MRPSQTYSVFHKQGKHWVRLSPLAFKKPGAVRLFQDMLLAGSFAGFEMALRPASHVAPETEQDRVISAALAGFMARVKGERHEENHIASEQAQSLRLA